MCQPELCTQHLGTVKERQSGKRNHLHLFSSLLFRWRSLAVNTVRVTLPSVSIALSRLSCRAEIVGSSENFCQENQTWQYPHPICKSKCALAMVVWACMCVALSSWIFQGDQQKMEWQSLVWSMGRETWMFILLGCTFSHCVHVFMSVPICENRVNQRRRQTETHTSSITVFSSSTALFDSALLPSCG